MFGIGGTELVIIMVFALMIFGPDKLPQLGRTIGKFSREFKRAQDQMEAQIKREMDALDDSTGVKQMKDDMESVINPESKSDVDWDEEEEEEA